MQNRLNRSDETLTVWPASGVPYLNVAGSRFGRLKGVLTKTAPGPIFGSQWGYLLDHGQRIILRPTWYLPRVASKTIPDLGKLRIIGGDD